ncbi:hypothetical protein Goari_019608 [Gossypium aridum]|uniref:Reverse transcriptase domain-containing protein n=1 Tax=Gossypium aridum TaxID=34290 RepID=A0A7J8WTP2_GOSAI|nr:hypothetical protein [Gossypium aridum]
MFANDWILFGKASENGENVLKNILREYEGCTGQCGGINYRIQDGVSDQDMRLVVDLIEPNTRRWKNDLIQSTFSERDIEKILNIPFSRCPSEDHITWRGEASSEYSVRSEYKLLLQGLTNPNARQEQNTKDKSVHEKERQVVLYIVNFIKNYIKELDDLMRILLEKWGVMERWKRLENAHVKVNFDIGNRKNEKRSCSGIMIRDSRGKRENAEYHSIPSPQNGDSWNE